MRIGIIGSGRIGGGAARLYTRAGHHVLLSFARSRQKLEALATELGERASVGSPADAAAFGDVVMLAVPWEALDEANSQAGGLEGKVVIDTTNQFGPHGLERVPGGLSAAEFNQRRMPGARLVKAYNTLTAAFQAEAAARPAADRVAMFLAGEDAAAKETVAQLIADSGFEPVDIGGWREVWIMEAPRRDGAVYGEEYRPADGRRIAAVIRDDPRGAAELARRHKVDRPGSVGANRRVRRLSMGRAVDRGISP